MTDRESLGRQLGSDGDIAASRLQAISAWLPLVIVVAGILPYLSSFSGAFVFDDGKHIVDNEKIRQLWPPWELITASRRPVVALSLALNYHFGELRVWGYHAFNLAVHILAGLTLSGIICRTLRNKSFTGRYARAAPWLAASASIIWLVHPLQTQSVTYIIQRGESLMGLFYLLTLYCAVRGVSSRHPVLWYGACVAACAIAMGSKAVAVTAPVIVLLYDRTFLATSVAEAFRKRWGLYAGLGATWIILFVCGVVWGVVNPTPRAGSSVGLGFSGATPLQYALTQPGVILQYLRLTLWPHAQCLDYAWPMAAGVRDAVAPATVIVLLIAVMIIAARRRPWVGFLGAWFFVILAPTSSIIPIRDAIYEHRMYLPLAAPVVAVVIGAHLILCRIFDQFQPRRSVQLLVPTGLTLCVAVALGFTTAKRNEVYRSNISMWADVASNRPHNARAHYNLGNSLRRADRREEAVEAYRDAIIADATHVNAHHMLGTTLSELRLYDEAAEQYRQAVKLDPGFVPARMNLARNLLRQGLPDAAIAELRLALDNPGPRIGPDILAAAHTDLAAVLVNKGRLVDAEAELRQAMSLNRFYPDLHYHFGRVFIARGEIDQGIQAFENALKLDPKHAKARQALQAAAAK